jgi:hypothetical protein
LAPDQKVTRERRSAIRPRHGPPQRLKLLITPAALESRAETQRSTSAAAARRCDSRRSRCERGRGRVGLPRRARSARGREPDARRGARACVLVRRGRADKVRAGSATLPRALRLGSLSGTSQGAATGTPSRRSPTLQGGRGGEVETPAGSLWLGLFADIPLLRSGGVARQHARAVDLPNACHTSLNPALGAGLRRDHISQVEVAARIACSPHLSNC